MVGLGGGGVGRLFLLAMVVGVSATLYIKFHHLLTISSLRLNHSVALDMVAANPVLAPMCYIGVLVVVIGLTCPGATMLSFIGGIFFEQPYASMYAYVGYIVGATISFFVTTFILGDYMRRRLSSMSSLFSKFETNVRRNAFVYLVAARYTMVFPFFFVNAAAALVGVNWRTFVAATSISCIPGAVVYTTAGRALASMLHKLGDKDDIDKSELLWMAFGDPNVRACLGALSCVLVVLGIVRVCTGKQDAEGEKAQKSD